MKKSFFSAVVGFLVCLCFSFFLNDENVRDSQSLNVQPKTKFYAAARIVTSDQKDIDTQLDSAIQGVPNQRSISPPQGRHYTLITGRLINNGQPYQDCKMYLMALSETAPLGFQRRENPTFFDRTNDRGRFLFAITNPGRYEIGIAMRVAGDPFRFSQTISITNEQNSVRDIGNLDITQKESIYGQVTDPRGVPLPHVSVIARINETVVMRTLTGADGRYRLGFQKRNETVELLFLPRPPFKGHLESARVLVKQNGREVLLDRVLDEVSPGDYSNRVFLYTKLFEPKDKSFQTGPNVYVFQDGQFIFEREIIYKEGVGSAILHLKPGRYYVCLKYGSNLAIGRHIDLEQGSFKAFELTEYDVVPYRKITLELEMTNDCREHPKDRNLFKVAFLEQTKESEKRQGVFPRFPIQSREYRLTLKVPEGIALLLEDDLTININKEDRFLSGKVEGLVRIRAKCVLEH